MGEGLQRATLAALCSRGPWTGDDNPTGLPHLAQPFTLTGDDLRAFYDAIAHGDEHPHRVLGVTGSHRKADRAYQLLRRAGLIEYAGKPKRWRVRGGP